MESIFRPISAITNKILQTRTCFLLNNYSFTTFATFLDDVLVQGSHGGENAKAVLQPETFEQVFANLQDLRTMWFGAAGELIVEGGGLKAEWRPAARATPNISPPEKHCRTMMGTTATGRNNRRASGRSEGAGVEWKCVSGRTLNRLSSHNT